MERHDSLSDRTHNLNPVVVTGSGHHQRLKTTATPVRVMSAQEIREQGISTIDGVFTRMIPQVSMAPNSMGTFLRMNGLGNKYILILINGQRLSGDISNNIDLSRINLSRIKRIEVLDGAASSLYGSDAIAGVINIITDQPTQQMVSVTSDTRLSGEGQFTESFNIDILKNGWGSYTTFTHDQADSYQTNDLEYVKGSDTETQHTIAPFFTGYKNNVLEQRLSFSPKEQLALNAGIILSHKITDRPDTREDVGGGTDYEMRYKGLRWYVNGIYKFSSRQSLQADFTIDRFRYGKEYDVATKNYAIGDYVQSKKQHSAEGELKAILHLLPNRGLMASATTIFGADWRKDFLTAISGDICQNVSTVAAYVQHEQKLLSNLSTTIGARYTHHETFGSHFTPKATLMYSPGPLNFRLSYSAGFRAPGLDELYYHYFSVNRGKPQIIFGNMQLSPEKSHYFSFNTEYHSHVIVLSVTGFLNRIADMVVRNNVDVNQSVMAMLQTEFPEMTPDQAVKLERYSLYTNSDKGLVKGFHVNISANLFKGFNITANYSYTNASTKSNDDWQVLDRSIRNTATFAANWQKRFFSRYTLNLNLNGRFQSKTYYQGYENAPGFGLWNIYSSHSLNLPKWAAFTASIGIDNLFNRVDRRIDSPDRKYALFSPGRMIVVGLRVKLSKQ